MMKRLFSMLLCVVMLFALASCAWNVPTEPPSDSERITLQTGNAGNETNQSETETTEPSQTQVKEPAPNGTLGEVKAWYPIETMFCDAKTRIVYADIFSILFYYNKFTGESHKLCFDPLCPHDDYYCISYCFAEAARGIQAVRYCEYDNRFYILRGAKFCSFAFDGSDLKIVHSFGESGNFEDELELMAYLPTALHYLKIKGKYCYFQKRDNETGKDGLMRYDVETGEMKSLFFDETTYVDGYWLADDVIYLNLSGKNYAGIYRMDYDGKQITKLSEDSISGIDSGIFIGEQIFYFQDEKRLRESNGMEYYATQKLVSYHLKTDTYETVMDINADTKYKLLAVTEDFIYYTVYDPVSVGFYETTLWGKQEYFNSYSRIYRFDRRSGEVIKVLDDPQCETFMIYFYEDLVFLAGQKYTVSQTRAGGSQDFVIAQVDENGMFVNWVDVNINKYK